MLICFAARRFGYTRPMTKIVLNGELRELAEATSVAALLDAAGYAQCKVAVEINREIVPKSLHAQRVLHDGDHVEIVHAIGGG
jgi:sulfur carrier protein